MRKKWRFLAQDLGNKTVMTVADNRCSVPKVTQTNIHTKWKNFNGMKLFSVSQYQ